MSYQALARKWRPKTFDEVTGQEHVVSALVNALDNQRIHHAFLFAGTRGVGKTTLARIFAKALNCEQGIGSTPCGQCVPCQGVDQGNFIDLIEVDAASRTKVDDTRELLDNVQYTPSQGRFKIYLIDEVHMLSTHSFNALLKTLEEPPEHVKFLLATTDPQKLPTTILSRCIQFNLKAMDIGRLTAQLEKIVEAEGVKYDAAALLILARSADGSVRDALSLLDQGIAFGNGEVNSEQMRAMLGMIDDQFIHQLLARICRGEAAAALETVAEMAQRSVDFSTALDEVLSTLHDLSLYQLNPQAVEWKGVDSSALAELAQQADAELLQLLYQIALIGKRDLPLAPDPRSGFEMVVLRMIAFRPEQAAGGSSPGPGPAPGKTPTGVAKNRQPAAPAAPAAAQGTPTQPTPPPPAEPTGRNDTAYPPTDQIRADAVSEAASGGRAVASGNGAGAGTGADGKVVSEARKQPAEADAAPDPAADSRAPAGETLAQLLDGARWAACVERSGLNGLTREMMLHMLPESVDGNTLRLRLDADKTALLDDSRLKKVEQHLAERFSLPVKLEVTTAPSGAAPNAPTETPAQRQARAQREEQQAAVQAFQHDPKVQELVDLFDAEIVSDSIRPPASPNPTDSPPSEASE